MFSIYTEKEEEIPILTDLRLPVRRSEQHERSCKLKHIIILSHDAVRRVSNLLCFLPTFFSFLLFNLFRKFCVTPVVSHVFLQIVARELGTRVPKNVPFCACPTFGRCVGVGAGGGVAQEIACEQAPCESGKIRRAKRVGCGGACRHCF